MCNNNFEVLNFKNFFRRFFVEKISKNIQKLIAEGKISSAAVALMNAAAVLNGVYFDFLNKKIKKAKNKKISGKSFPSRGGRVSRGGRWGNGHN